nr:TIGR04282 family arsenosugar biosynthesis glycosyltransferase [Methylomonas sp. SURF-2]
MLIFCKAPIASQVKTRLQPALSARQAVDAHIALTRMTIARACQTPLCPVILCCAPDSDQPFFQQCADEFPLTLATQHGDDLGARMHNAFSKALSHYRYAVLTGCDCPSLTVDDLRQAFSALQNGKDAIVAPAEDGGYVLIGLNAPQADLFQDMPWSTDSVMTETRRRAASAGLNLHELSTQWDVDTIADWKRYLS